MIEITVDDDEDTNWLYPKLEDGNVESLLNAVKLLHPNWWRINIEIKHPEKPE